MLFWRRWWAPSSWDRLDLGQRSPRNLRPVGPSPSLDFSSKKIPKTLEAPKPTKRRKVKWQRHRPQNRLRTRRSYGKLRRPAPRQGQQKRRAVSYFSQRDSGSELKLWEFKASGLKGFFRCEFLLQSFEASRLAQYGYVRCGNDLIYLLGTACRDVPKCFWLAEALRP